MSHLHSGPHKLHFSSTQAPSQTQVLFQWNPGHNILVSPPSINRRTSIKVHRFASLLHQVRISNPSRSPYSHLTPILVPHIKVPTTTMLCSTSIQVLTFVSHFHPGDVSLTCICSKMMEHIICHNLMSHLDHHKMLTDHQFGFRKKRSCETQLLITIKELANLESLDSGKQIDCTLLDFSKAFDEVSHKHHIIMLQHYGVQGPTLCWKLRRFWKRALEKSLSKGSIRTSSQSLLECHKEQC